LREGRGTKEEEQKRGGQRKKRRMCRPPGTRLGGGPFVGASPHTHPPGIHAWYPHVIRSGKKKSFEV